MLQYLMIYGKTNGIIRIILTRSQKLTIFINNSLSQLQINYKVNLCFDQS